jgi:general stress protein 26
MNDNLHADDRQAKLYDLIKDVKFAMFTTHKPQGGHLHSRPMTTKNEAIDEEDALWFFMSRAGAPVSEFQGDDQVNVSYSNPDAGSYVSVSGVAHVVDDETKKRALWKDADAAWFSGGVEDPDLALVRVDIEHADYWDVSTNKVVRLYEMAKAALGGQAMRPATEHARVRPH